MNAIVFIGLGALIWQVVIFSVMILTNEDDEKTIWTACGIPLLLFNTVMKILKRIRAKYIRKNYIMAHIWNEKGSNDKPLFLHNVRIKKGTLQRYYLKGENQYYIEEWYPEWKSIENAENIKHVMKNGWFCQDWINKNLVKNTTK